MKKLMENKRNVWLLPTDKPSNITIRKRTGELVYDEEPFTHDEYDVISNQNIYITSDEEIKEGDWVIANDEDVMQMKSSYDNDMTGEDIWVGDSLNGYATYKDNCKKIILTTDQDLIKDGVQAIDDEFLEWFVKNPSCESIEVENQYRVKSGTIQEHIDGIAGYEYYEYKIIIPKEEPKTNLDRLPFPELVKEFAEYYENVPLVEEPKQETIEKDPCNFCGKTLREQMKGCNEITCYRQFLNKQETLEEVAEKYAEHQLTGIDDKFSKFECINDFIAGAKWQQEQDKNKYSEEEVKDMLFEALNHKKEECCIKHTTDSIVRKVIEQFKKK